MIAFPNRHILPCVLSCLLLLGTAERAGADETARRPELRVPRTEDFQVTGDGTASAWEKTGWTPLNIRPDASVDYSSKVKMLYSETGVYVLFEGTDKKLNATQKENNGMIWTEDVFEVYLWPDERHPLYLEYELSPLGYELPILVPNIDGKIMGWLPWFYMGSKAVQKKVKILGGPQEPHADIEGWRAEIFIPYDLLRPMGNVPPQAGTKWRGNFYRMDYDGKEMTGWDWARVDSDFHEYQKFGDFIFE